MTRKQKRRGTRLIKRRRIGKIRRRRRIIRRIRRRRRKRRIRRRRKWNKKKYLVEEANTADKTLTNQLDHLLIALSLLKLTISSHNVVFQFKKI